MLVKEDIKALKTCTDVVLRLMEGQSTIEAKVRDSNGSVFSGEQKRLLQVGTKTHIYERAGEGRKKRIERAFELIYAAQLDPVWTTIVGFLKVGDELTLRWRAAEWNLGGFFQDSVHLIIERKGKEMEFILYSSVCEDNSARMCQVKVREDA